MSSCILELSSDSPLRTTLVNQSTRRVQYEIKTPIRISGSVTRIWRFEPRVHTLLRSAEGVSSGSADDVTNRTELKVLPFDEAGGNGIDLILPKVGEEIARVHWKWFSRDKVMFQGGITAWNQFLPPCMELKE